MTFLGVLAQAQTVSGKITDGLTGEGIPGVNILIKGTTSGTVTDVEGNYTLEAAEDATLVFSFVGYKVHEAALNGQTAVNIALDPDLTELDEIVVTGYGTQQRKEVTGSITSLKTEDFNQGNMNDVGQLLQGKVPGLTITRPGANPNGDYNIRLRGLSSLGTTSPLIVIDGVLGGDLNSVEPQDIESIDVLKDGSAAAIYGTRGAAGVILITTKKGIPGAPSIDYSGQFTFETVAKKIEVLQAEEYRNFPRSTDLGGEVNWFDEITQTGLTHMHNLSLSGGTENTTYRISGNFRNVEGIAKTTGFQRTNFRVNLQQRAVDDRLKITMNLATTTEDADLGHTDAFKYATIYNPTAPFIRDVNDPDFAQWDGYYQRVVFDLFNPVAVIEQNINESQTKTLTANIRGDFDVTDDLSVGLFYSQQRNNVANRIYYSKNSDWPRNVTSRAIQRNDEQEDQLFRMEANYKKALAGNINLNAIVAYEYQDFINQGFSAQGGDFLTDAFKFNNLSGAADFNNGLGTVESYKNTNTLIAFFGRINANFNDKFFATGSLRREGSSRFGENEKWGWFPALSAGVDLANVLDMGAFDNLKLRVGFGVTGANVEASYLSLQRFEPTGNFFFNGEFIQSFGPASNPNPDLKWETKTDLNIGVDFVLLDYKLTGSLEYYTTKTEDLILEFNVPVPPNLFPQTFLNIGEMRNKGLELALNYIGRFSNGNSWSVGLMANRFFDSELVSLSDEARGLDFGGSQERANLGSPGQNGTNMILLEEGKPIGQIWTLVVDESNPVNEDGSWNVLDTDGDGVQDDILDRTITGNGLPEYQLGLNSSFNFGNLDVNLFFRGVFGHDLVNTFRAFYEAPSTINDYNILAGSQDIIDLLDQPLLSSYHVEKGDFFKLDNMTIGYTIPKLGKTLKTLRFYFTAQNIFTITGYSGASPEPRLVDTGEFPDINSTGGVPTVDPLSPGIDRRIEYFTARSFTFGVNLGL